MGRFNRWAVLGFDRLNEIGIWLKVNVPIAASVVVPGTPIVQFALVHENLRKIFLKMDICFG